MKILLILVLFSSLCIANNKVEIIALEIEGLHQESLTGDYDQIINTILIKPGLANLSIYPVERAMNAFNSPCQNCCLSPVNKDAEFYNYDTEQYLQTDILTTAKVYIFTAKGMPVINSLRDLKDKNVGVSRGVSYGKAFNEANLTTFPVKNIIQNIKKLDLKRIDAFVAFAPDVFITFKNMGIEPYPHDSKNPIVIHHDRLVCRGVSPSFIDHFNKELNVLRSNKN